jgi:hypothetical protein
MTASVQLEKKIAGRESQGAWHQEELIGGKPPIVKYLTLTLTIRVWGFFPQTTFSAVDMHIQ